MVYDTAMIGKTAGDTGRKSPHDAKESNNSCDVPSTNYKATATVPCINTNTHWALQTGRTIIVQGEGGNHDKKANQKKHKKQGQQQYRDQVKTNV
eukprot:m.349000 g.349000  ORF g.349000 m.349000 type:complete len:95 (-) comp16148_c8_seq2:13275-13559(-)